MFLHDWRFSIVLNSRAFGWKEGYKLRCHSMFWSHYAEYRIHTSSYQVNSKFTGPVYILPFRLRQSPSNSVCPSFSRPKRYISCANFRCHFCVPYVVTILSQILQRQYSVSSDSTYLSLLRVTTCAFSQHGPVMFRWDSNWVLSEEVDLASRVNS